ncbi:hypothetical protein [Streptomyces sporangiiformans]|uniref:Uncharacterized protein n=1 Tax=Streptomyces sporangiiformans TaxID=2315329 RepID=A0A505D2Y2_9ACTN|nr:hypothetical protein [Streptomyces sporangiiformans]TPQ18044.1 hypothetical protein FGD71_032735 [Streptomyces sporangiiformans]
MAVMTETLVPALEDARQAHAAVLDRLRADAAVTPPGPYRQMLERQADDVQDSVQRIEHHVRELRPRGLLGGTTDVARLAARTTVRAAMLPVTIGQRFVTGVLQGQGPADERRLLRNTEDEYATAARALAVSRAGEVLAEQVQDQATIDLLTTLRRQNQELLATLEDSVAAQARSVAAAGNGNGFRPEQSGYRGLVEAATRTVLTAADRLRDAARTGGRRTRGAAEGAMREMPEATRVAEQVQGAVTREEDLPIARFSQLSADEIQRRLRSLSQSELTVIEGYERSHANRPGVLDAIEHLRGGEPWPGYDAMEPSRIMDRLQNEPLSVARQVLEHERRHRRRQTIISAAEARVPA